MRFAKWQGLGNDYIIVDEREIPEQHASAAGGLADDAVTAMCDRHFGIGGDGILVIGSSDVAPVKMLIHNPDASRAEMCGNGIRMFARYLVEQGTAPAREFNVETEGGIVRPSVLDDGRVRVDMGTATSEGHDEVELEDGSSFGGRVVSVGNPHFVIRRDPSGVGLHDIGPRLEHHPRFPDRTNVEFYEAESASRVTMRVWERGAGETLACGTGACAVGLTAVLDAGCTSPVTVVLPGGELEIEVGADQRIWMTGPAEQVYAGEADLDALLAAAARRAAAPAAS